MNLLIIDDHQLFSAGLRILLQELCPGASIFTANSVSSAFEKSNTYDLILLDFFLPDSRGLDGLVRVKARYPATPIAVVSSDIDSKTIRECVDNGAMGFVPKASAPSELLKAITTILAGGTYLPRQCVGDLQPTEPLADPSSSVQLTPRQKEVLTCVVVGKSNKTIAKELGISDQTVKSHVVAVLFALGAKNRTAAVYRAAFLGV